MNSRKRIIALILALAALALLPAGCSDPTRGQTPSTGNTETEPPKTEPPVTEPPVTEPPVTEPPVTEPPVTEPPVTEPPVTEPPVTEPPETDPPVTQPPETDPSETQPPETKPPETTPPETKPPETKPPETKPPETKPPETKPPETKPPETKPPETKPPETKPPETKPPETKPPETKPPETKPPETKPPETKPPETKPPETQPPATEPPKIPDTSGSLPSSSQADEVLDGKYTDKSDNKDNPGSDIGNESAALQNTPPAIPNYIKVSHPGTAAITKNNGTIDYSNVSEGYVMVYYSQSTSKRLKALVKGPTTQYQYNINAGEWVSLPLSDGKGNYTIGVYVQAEGSKYAVAVSQTVNVPLLDELAPFRYSNQYVDFESAPKTIEKAAQLCAGLTDPLDKVKAIYNFVVDTLSYDHDLAKTVKSGYLPVLDNVLAKKKGICFDYAALMTGMLRSQGVPCKLVIGYAGTAYHAWINVWSEKNGWINNAIFFDGTSWQRMDPTYASTGGQSKDIMDYIGDGQNYTVKYLY